MKSDQYKLKGLRILFVNMPIRESARPPEGPIGVALLAAQTRLHGAETSVIDFNAYRIPDKRKPNGLRWLTEEETRSHLKRHFNRYGEPHLVALSGMITTLRWQNLIARICRELLPEAFLVSGGGLATELREILFSWIPDLDAIVNSEGDEAILRVGESVLKGGGHQNRRMVYTGKRPADLNNLPFPAWDLFEQDVDGNPVLEGYIEIPVWGLAANNSSTAPFESKRSLTTISSRGCPYSCAFCYRGAQGERNWGMRSPENLAKEIAHLQDAYDIDFVGFVDDNFAVRVGRCQDLPRAFKGLDVRWGTHLRLDEAEDKRLRPMSQAGCIYGGFGAESASAQVLKRMGKGGQMLNQGLIRINGFDFPATMVKGIRACREFGIHANCTWIMGYPGETLDDLKTSVAFILWQEELTSPVNRRMFTATAYPGTKMFSEPVCRHLLSQHFGIRFQNDGQPITDDNLRHYIEELDDATKVMVGRDGRPLNWSNLSNDQFLTARNHIDSGQVEEILKM